MAHLKGDGRPLMALVTDAFGGYGGIAQYNRDLLNAFADLRQFSTVEIHPRGAEPPDTVSIGQLIQRLPLHNRLLYSLRALASAISLRPAVVFGGHLYHLPLALALSRVVGARLVSQLHGTEIWGSLGAIHKLALEKSDFIFCVSQHTKAKLLDQIDYPDDRVVVLPNRVGDAFNPKDRKESRKRFGLGSGPIVLSVSRLDDRGGYKGHDRILELMPPFRKKGIAFEYLIVGTGEDRPRLEQLVETLGLSDQVRFMGRVPSEDLPYLYSAADLFALPSTGEGFGIVYIEATACGTPAIGLNVGGTPEAMSGGALGDAVPPEAFAEAFESALLTALELDQQERNRLSQETITRFGGEAFRERVAEAVSLVCR